ncbi:hypothetical protein C8R47DRAFT_1090222 [Mycena vitilis]|nr:hypothetical protein C8R47DRAFT_1090222 [Mycena vitilis]
MAAITREMYHERQKIATPTAEQSAALEDGRACNVYVSGQPGSGKTALAIHAGISYGTSTERVLFIVPRRNLADDARNRLRGTEVHVETPWTMLDASFSAKGPYSRIIIDGFCDPTADLTACLLKLDLALRPPSLFVVAEGRGSMWTFFADHPIFGLVLRVWRKFSLCPSFTTSHETALLINEAYLAGRGETGRLAGSFKGPAPCFVRVERDDFLELYKFVATTIKASGPENCVILTPSVNFKKTPNHIVLLLLNKLTSDGIPVTHPKDGASLTLEETQGKVVVATFYQFQGFTRPVAFVFGTEGSYFRYFDRHLAQDRCPNAILSALTRAREELIIVHLTEYDYLPFVQPARLLASLKDLSPQRTPRDPCYGPPIPSRLGVTDVAKDFCDETRLLALLDQHLQIGELDPPLPERDRIRPPNSVCTDSTKKHYEDVSAINGNVVVAAFRAKHVNGLGSSLSDLVHDAINYESDRTQLIQRKTAMKNTNGDWLAEDLPRAVARLEAQFAPGAHLDFEAALKPYTIVVDQHSFTIEGRVDVLVQSPVLELWELKMVRALSAKNIFQPAMYGLLRATQSGSQELPPIILFNVQDGRKLKIGGTVEGARQLLAEVLREKYRLGA